ncbi:MAG TPA: site-2 protease family protein [Candidatus Limnocylindrales bacterium]|nr:site-2 protease family protein [Candidatus Limnocylindrales bacterium]
MLFSDPQQFIINALYAIPGLLLGLVLHEWAHARVAVARGDQTPRLDGRLSLDPSHHLDPLGTIAVFLIGFGWARPVRINPSRMRHRFDAALVALAGPAMNLLVAVGLSIPLRALISPTGSVATQTFTSSTPGVILITVLFVAFRLNVLLAVFNVLPVPPLDGYNLVDTLFRRRFPRLFFQIDSYRMVISLGLLLVLFLVPGVFTTVFNAVFIPISTLLGVAP